NYLFHHHLGINLITQSSWFEEANENYQWQTRAGRASVAFNQCLELEVPWADLHIQPDYPLRLMVVLADHSKFKSHVPEGDLIALTCP
ncbi:MAG: glycoside hydrolase, partial [Spirulinaceae cyanobacterium]